MMISSRTPEGEPNRCPVCGNAVRIEIAHPPGDAPCPFCGTLLWFFATSAGVRFYELRRVGPIRDRVLQLLFTHLRINKDRVSYVELRELGADSLDIVELVMELEEEFEVTISDEDAEKIRSVGDIIDYLVKRLRPPG